MKKVLIVIMVVISIGVWRWTSVEPTTDSTPVDTPQTTQLIAVDGNKILLRVPADYTTRPTTTSPQAPDGPASHWFYSAPITVPSDTIITGFSVAMEQADSSVLHHTSVSILDRPATLCQEHFAQDGGAYEIFSASRNTLDPIKLPSPYGIFLKTGEQLIVEFMMHAQATPHGAHHNTEEIQPTLVVTLETDQSRTTPVTFTRLRLDDSPCAPPLPHQAFVVPVSTSSAVYTKTKAGNEDSSSFTFATSTTIVAGGANFWPRKGGQSVAVLIDDTTVQTFLAEQTGSSNEWNIPLSYEPIYIPAESTIHISATYKNPFPTPVKDASGMYGFYYTIE